MIDKDICCDDNETDGDDGGASHLKSSVTCRRRYIVQQPQ